MYSSVNTIWILIGAALVFFMQAGFSMCEAGFTRAKNTEKPDGFLYRNPGFLAGWIWIDVWKRFRNHRFF